MPEIIDLIKELRRNAKRRNFVQTFDLIINLKDLDIRKPENRIDDFFVLPAGRGKKARVVVFSDSVKEIEGCRVLTSKDIEELGKDKRAAKKLANETDFFLSEPELMPVVGRFLGQVLGPRGKMPKPIVGDLRETVKKFENAVRIVVKKNPVVHTIVGIETMRDEDVAENVRAVVEFVKRKLPRGKDNVKSVLLKLTMSRPVEIRVV